MAVEEEFLMIHQNTLFALDLRLQDFDSVVGRSRDVNSHAGESFDLECEGLASRRVLSSVEVGGNARYKMNYRACLQTILVDR